MNVTIEEVSSIKRKLTVELPEQQAVDTRKKHLDKYTRSARLKGFRPGKAPRDLVAKLYADELHREVLEELVQVHVPEALKQYDLNPVGMPMLEEVDYKEGQPFIFTVLVELKPVFETPVWEGLELEKTKAEITEELLDKKLEELRLSLSTISKVEEDRTISSHELAEITYQAFKGEEEIKDIGRGPFKIDLTRDQMLPGFIEALMTMKAGEIKDILITMPEDHTKEELAGQELNLRTTLHSIHQREMPELDDEMAKDLAVEGVNTLSDLRQRLYENLSKEQNDRTSDMFDRQLTIILASLVEIEAPTAMVERELSNKVEGMRQEFKKNGVDFNTMGINEQLLRQRFHTEAVKSVTAALVLDQISRDNQIEATEEDLNKELELMSLEYGQTPEMLRSYYEARGLWSSFTEGLRISKTLELIKARAKIIEVDKINPEKLGLMPPTPATPKPKDEQEVENQEAATENQDAEVESQETAVENQTPAESEKNL